MRWRRICFVLCLWLANAWVARAENVVVIGYNASIVGNILQGSGHTVTIYGDASTVNAAALAGVDSVILLRAAGNTDIRNFVNGGGLLITEWDASGWALDTANLLNADDIGSSSSQDTVDFTSLGISSGLADGLGSSYTETGGTEYFRTFANIGAGVDIYGTRNSNSANAIIGGDSGDGFTMLIGYDWGDSISNNSLSKTLLLNALEFVPNIWDGSTDGNFSTVANWSQDVVPAAGDKILFGGNVNTTVNHDLTAGTIYRGIKFASSAGTFNITGNSMGIADGGAIVNGSSNEQTISVTIIAAGDLTIDAASGNLIFQNDLSVGSGKTITVTGAGDTTFSGTLTGSGSLAKTGTGTLSLMHANTFAGGTNLGGGVLVLGNDAALSTGNVTISASSTIQSDNNGRIVGNTFTINNGQVLSVDGTNNLELSGTLGGAGGLTKTGDSTLKMSGSGSNTYTGTTTVSGGVLELNKTNGNPSNDHGTAIRGNLVINSGATVKLLQDSQIGDSNFVSINGGTLEIGGHDETLNGITLNNGGQVTGTSGTGIGLNSSNGIATTGTGAASVSANIYLMPANPADQNARQFNIFGTAPLTISGNISDGNSAGAITKTGLGTLTLTGTNTYTGGTTVSAGTLAGNSNSLQGDITNNAAVEFDQASLGTYAGAMTGSGSLIKTGAGKLSITGNNNYAGGTTVSAGTLAGNTTSLKGHIINNATLEFNQSTDGTYAGVLTGSGNTNIDGTGKVTFTGNSGTYTGTTKVEAGELVLNNSLGGNVEVQSAATLSGTGTIGGSLTHNGTVAAGNGIGTFHVIGTADFGANSELKIEINDGGTVAGTNNDLLAVGGAVQINGGTVNVQVAAGTYVQGAQYTFLTGSTVTGAFDSIVDDLAFFTAQLGYTSTSAFFTLVADQTNHASVAATPNQIAVGHYFDDNSQFATGDLQTVINALQPLTTTQVQAALEQMSGELYGSTQQMGIQNTTLILHSLAQQLQPGLSQNGMNAGGLAQADTLGEVGESEIVRVSYQSDGSPLFRRTASRTHNTWAMGFGLGGDADSDGNAARLEYGMGGALVGMDMFVDRSHRLGLFGGYVGTGIDTANPASHNENSGAQMGSYYTGRNGNHYYTLLGGFQFDDHESQRFITTGGLNRTALGEYDGWQSFGYLERGVILYRSHQWSCQPFGGLQFVHVRQNGFSETGAGVLNLTVDGMDDDSLRSLVGLRTQARNNGRYVFPEFRAAWVHEFLDTNSPVVARFAPIGGAAFIAEGLDMGRDWALVGTGLHSDLGRGWSAQANYDAQINENQAFHVGSGSIQKVW